MTDDTGTAPHPDDAPDPVVSTAPVAPPAPDAAEDDDTLAEPVTPVVPPAGRGGLSGTP